MLSLEGTRASSPTTRRANARWPTWTGETAVVIGTGPSLTQEQIALAAGKRVLVLNDAGLARRWPLSAAWADVLYAADRTWWSHYRPNFAGLRVSGEEEPVKEGLADIQLQLLNGDGPPTWEPGVVLHGGFGGAQALQAAIGWGATRVLLLGFDCRFGRGGATNCFGNKPSEIHKDSPYRSWVEFFDRLRPLIPDGVEVLNCTPGSAITAFPTADMGDFA